jgi:hypothetical protein
VAFADPPPGPFFQGFETDTSGWFDSSTNAPSGTITREPSGYTNGGGYGNGITSADGSFHARINFDQCANDATAPPAPTSNDCNAPFTRWGGYSSTFPAGGFSTSLDIYLDTAWATTHTDYRFDWSDAINDTAGNFLQEYVFNAGTAPIGGTGFFVNASTNATRSGAFPENPCPDPGPTATPPNACRAPVNITTSGWYTFTHTFRDDAGSLAVDMSITPVGSGTPVASWTILTDKSMSGVGGNRYGAFDNDEIADLAIDDSMRTGTQSPPIPEAPWTAGLLLLGVAGIGVPLVWRRRSRSEQPGPPSVP